MKIATENLFYLKNTKYKGLNDIDTFINFLSNLKVEENSESPKEVTEIEPGFYFAREKEDNHYPYFIKIYGNAPFLRYSILNLEHFKVIPMVDIHDLVIGKLNLIDEHLKEENTP